MTVLLDPALLQLIGIGADDSDDQLTRGRHLRWFPNETLGFPRRGFLLFRRPSPAWPWHERGDVVHVDLTQEERTQSIHGGVRVDATVDRTPDSDATDRAIRLSSHEREVPARTGPVQLRGGVRIELLDRRRRRVDPAAWVAITLSGDENARVTAVASGSGAGADTTDFSRVEQPLGSLPGETPKDDPHEDRVVLLHGSLVDTVELRSNGRVQVTGVSWLVARHYATDIAGDRAPDDGWEVVDRYLLPIDGDDTTYPAQSDPRGAAKTRVRDGAGKTHPPWEWPDPSQPEEVGTSVVGDAQVETYLGENGGRLDEVQTLLSGILDQADTYAVPQGTVTVEDIEGEERLTDQASDSETHLEGVPALDLVLSSSLDAPMGRALGLATVDDTPPPTAPYDYMVSAAYPLAWLAAALGVDDGIGLGDLPAEDQRGLLGESLRRRHRGQVPVVPPMPSDRPDDDDGDDDDSGGRPIGPPVDPPPDPPSDDDDFPPLDQDDIPTDPSDLPFDRDDLPFDHDDLIDDSEDDGGRPFDPPADPITDPEIDPDPDPDPGPVIPGQDDDDAGESETAITELWNGRDFFQTVSLVTALREGPPSPVPAPADLTATGTAAPERDPPAEVHLDWTLPWQDTSWFDPAQPVGLALSRTDDAGTEWLVHEDPESDEDPEANGDSEPEDRTLPLLSGADRRSFVDASLRELGEQTWTVQTLDLWGRWSLPATETATIEHEVPPPSPPGLSIMAEGAIDEDAGTIERAELSFRWSPDAVPPAADVDQFVIDLAAGHLDVESDTGLANPGFSVTMDAPSVLTGDGPVDIDDAVSGPDAGAVSRLTSEDDDTDGDDDSITVDLALRDVPAVEPDLDDESDTDEDLGRWDVTAAVHAVDETTGNESRPAVGHAEQYDPSPPAEPEPFDDVAETTWPDADGICWWTCEWSLDEGDRVTVLRTSASRLLAEAGMDRSALAEMDRGGRAAELRKLAADDPDHEGTNRHAFSPDHEGYHGHDGSHDVGIEASSRELTVVRVQPTSASGVQADWPTDPEAFAVVATRRLESVQPPRVQLRATHTTDDEPAVELTVSTTAAPSRVLVWRTTDESVDDLRQLTALPPIDLDSGSATVIHPADADEWYAYRVAVETPGGQRSDPTEPTWVKTR